MSSTWQNSRTAHTASVVQVQATPAYFVPLPVYEHVQCSVRHTQLLGGPTNQTTASIEVRPIQPSRPERLCPVHQTADGGIHNQRPAPVSSSGGQGEAKGISGTAEGFV